MKIGNVEGSPQEITDFFENNGLDLSALIELPPNDVHWRWVAIPTALTLPEILLLVFAELPDNARLFITLLACGFIIWLGNSVKSRWGSWSAIFTAIAAFLLVAVSAGYISLGEIVVAIREYLSDG